MTESDPGGPSQSFQYFTSILRHLRSAAFDIESHSSGLKSGNDLAKLSERTIDVQPKINALVQKCLPHHFPIPVFCICAIDFGAAACFLHPVALACSWAMRTNESNATRKWHHENAELVFGHIYRFGTHRWRFRADAGGYHYTPRRSWSRNDRCARCFWRQRSGVVQRQPGCYSRLSI